MWERKGFKHLLEYNPSASVGESEKAYTAEAQDICSGGLRILTRHPLAKGMVVRLDFPVNDLELLLPVFAEVAWAVPADNGFNAGLRFLR